MAYNTSQTRRQPFTALMFTSSHLLSHWAVSLEINFAGMFYLTLGVWVYTYLSYGELTLYDPVICLDQRTPITTWQSRRKNVRIRIDNRAQYPSMRDQRERLKKRVHSLV